MQIGYLMQEGCAPIRTKPNSGPSSHVTHVIGALQARNHDVQMLAKLEDGRIWRSSDLHHYQIVETPPFDRGPLRLFERALRRTQSELKLPYAAFFESARFARACAYLFPQADLLCERMGWMGYGGGIASRFLGVPLVLEVNGDYLEEVDMLGLAPTGAQRRLELFLMRHAIARAAHIITTGNGWRQRFLERWPHVDPANVTSVENGSDLVEMLTRKELRSFRAPSRAEESNDSRPVTIVHVGGLQPWQGVSTLLRAFAQVRAQNVRAHLIIIGGGSALAEMKALAASLNIAAAVTFTGSVPLERCAAHLADADIGVSAYCGRAEFSGLKLLDYKAAGLAIIASGRNGEPAILRHKETGWIVPPCSEEALVDALLHLCANPALRTEMGQRARAEAERTHSWRHTTQRLEQIFEEVASRAKHRSRSQLAHSA